MFDQFTKTLSEFSQYDNVLAVDVGNEVITNCRYSVSSRSSFGLSYAQRM